MDSQIISFNCILKNTAGHLISSTYNRDVLTAIDNDQAMLLGLSRGLLNLKKGEKRKISLSAAEAYGFYDLKKIILYPTKKLPKDLRVGQSISIVGKSGSLRTYKIVQFHSDMVSLDGNHPLAGQDLIFEIEALDVRDATAEEVVASQNTVGLQLLH